MRTRAPTTTHSAPAVGRIVPPVIAVAALGWNLFGVVKFLETLESTPESLTQMGMTPDQAAVYASYPTWMTVAFAVGVFGGLVGSGLLLARQCPSVPVFAASLAGYLILYVGDITEGVFAALGAPQVAVLTTVVLIATGLFFWSRWLFRADRAESAFSPQLQEGN